MKRPVFLFSIVLIFSLLAGCSKMNVAGVTAAIYQEVPEGYGSLAVNDGITVEVSADNDMVEIVSDTNVLPYVEVYVQGGVLTIEYEAGVRFSGSYQTIVRIPHSRSMTSVKLRSGSVFASDVIMESDSRLGFDGTAGSRFDISGIAANDMQLSLADGSAFLSGDVDVNNLSLSLTDGSYAAMDGHIAYCNAIMEDGAYLSPRTSSYFEKPSLTVDRFNGNLSDGSKASFYSDGLLTGTLRDGSSVQCDGNAKHDLVIL